MKYVDRNDVDAQTRTYKDAIIAIYDALQKKRKHSDNTDLMVCLLYTSYADGLYTGKHD